MTRHCEQCGAVLTWRNSWPQHVTCRVCEVGFIKACTKCGAEKFLSEFYRHGDASWCKDCQRAASRAAARRMARIRELTRQGYPVDSVFLRCATDENGRALNYWRGADED